MDATTEYTQLITYRIQNPLSEGESHHIVPRACGGGDYENIVKLTREEHQRAHRLLPLIYKDGPEHVKLERAAVLAQNSFRWTGKHLSAEHKEAIGRANSRPHKPFTAETRAKMSASAKRRWEAYRASKGARILPKQLQCGLV
jgi:5-methylcytosine-specific restriction endonuclease McrA